MPLKVTVFLWRARLNRLPTEDNLKKRRINIQNRLEECVLWKEEPEILDNLLFKCMAVKQIWNHYYAWLGIVSAMQATLEEHYRQHYIIYLNAKVNKRWRVLWCVIIWRVWNTRNNVLFKGAPLDNEQVLKEILLYCWLWRKGIDNNFQYSFVQWMVHPGECLKG